MKTTLLTLTLIVGSLMASAQLHTFTNGEMAFYVNYDELYDEYEEIEFSFYGDCELKGTMMIFYVNRRATGYEGPDWYQWSEGDCTIEVDVPNSEEPSALKVRISGECDCVNATTEENETFRFQQM